MVRIMTDLSSRTINTRINKFQIDGIRWGGSKRGSSDYIFDCRGQNLELLIASKILSQREAEAIFDSGDTYFLLRMRSFK
ncbi:hypothetical protein THMIRHAS_17000 [Thiosulfatimonas sediminis]|uniref:Uncharacterized protein n=1 Tax=Thiosulfatimonas sediminis TaxID=2675054 RepID=A0A6F8PWB3_9GAMM|nr:hypothetical protein THMIRHAS_17000 [Thiosulfatimonas sediminis]